jgi:uncharacterized membrane protein (DUF373 family)
MWSIIIYRNLFILNKVKMKKLVNLLSLVVLLGVIAFIRVGYAQESENPEV